MHENRCERMKLKVGDLVTWRAGLAQPPDIIIKVSLEGRQYLICFPGTGLKKWCTEGLLKSLTSS